MAAEGTGHRTGRRVQRLFNVIFACKNLSLMTETVNGAKKDDYMGLFKFWCAVILMICLQL